LINEQLRRLKSAGLEIELLASAAPGSDIICHEVCGELQVRSSLCLPMPRDAYASEVFGSLDRWRSRYLGLLDLLPVLELSDRIGLPSWLGAPPGADPWERGNRWVLEMARARGARRVTLLALWSGREEAGLPGGTGDMVRIARQSGMVDVVVIDANQLLAD
jgi:hypothetical protein